MKFLKRFILAEILFRKYMFRVYYYHRDDEIEVSFELLKPLLTFHKTKHAVWLLDLIIVNSVELKVKWRIKNNAFALVKPGRDYYFSPDLPVLCSTLSIITIIIFIRVHFRRHVFVVYERISAGVNSTISIQNVWWRS